MNWRLTSAAEEDLHDILAWYADPKRNNAIDFLDEYEIAIRRILHNPEGWRPIGNAGYRRCLLDRLPYGIYYRVDNSVLIVVAVVHHRRAPGVWRERLE